MAGDWIKVEKATARKPEVLRIADRLGIHPDHAFGLCVRFWFWCDDQLARGYAQGVTPAMIDVALGCVGFAQIALDVGWLRERSGRISIPNFDRHLSKSAKKRASSGERMRLSRSKNRCANVAPKAQPEKRRTEKRREETKTELTGQSAQGQCAVETGPDPADHKKIFVETSRVEHLAASLFRHSGYQGSDGSVFWKIAALVYAGRITESAALDAANGCGSVSPRPKSIPAYFVAVLKASTSEDIKAAMRTVHLIPELPRKPPDCVRMRR